MAVNSRVLLRRDGRISLDGPLRRLTTPKWLHHIFNGCLQDFRLQSCTIPWARFLIQDCMSYMRIILIQWGTIGIRLLPIAQEIHLQYIVARARAF